jgi:hypothetical protein
MVPLATDLRAVSTRVFWSRYGARDGVDLQLDGRVIVRKIAPRDQCGAITRTITTAVVRSKEQIGPCFGLEKKGLTSELL